MTLSIFQAWRLDQLPRTTTVEVDGYFYVVDFGEGVRPQLHRVSGRYCDCYLGALCPALKEVEDHLEIGGARAKDPPPGFYPYVPAGCPVCGAECYLEPSLTNRKRGIGWACTSGGTLHYWQAMTRALQHAREANPWVFEPKLDHAGRVLYPGVRRDELGG